MSFLRKVFNKIFPSKQAYRVKPWFACNGDKTHRLNYDLDESSIVFDLGGYEGQWASDIFAKYLANVYVFEPFSPFAENIRKRFAQNQKIKVFTFGLGGKDYILPIFGNQDATSSFKRSGERHEMQIKKASTFIAQTVPFVDLMKINIEGGEYELLEELIASGDVNKVRNIQVQFHDFVPDAEQRMRNIQNKLKDTHEITYQFEFVWENWRLKQSSK